MSKSLGNVAAAGRDRRRRRDILRLWTASVDYSDDQRIGPKSSKFTTDNYRKLRNTIRWMLGARAFRRRTSVDPRARRTRTLMLHRLAEVDATSSRPGADFDVASAWSPP